MTKAWCNRVKKWSLLNLLLQSIHTPSPTPSQPSGLTKDPQWSHYLISNMLALVSSSSFDFVKDKKLWFLRVMIVLGEFLLSRQESLVWFGRSRVECFHKQGNEKRREGCTGERLKKSGNKGDNNRELCIQSKKEVLGCINGRSLSCCPSWLCF